MLDQFLQCLEDFGKYSGPLSFILAFALAAFSVLAWFKRSIIRKYLGKRSTPPVDTDAERISLLNNVGNQIRQWQDDTFAQEANLSLRYSGDPDRVSQHWLSTWFRADLQPVPTGATIGEIFERSNRRLLIVGYPGAGKSNELYRLADALHIEASTKSEEPIPVVLNLTSWAVDQHEDLGVWIAQQLHESYKVRADRTQFWKDRLIPLLDGLDEVKSEVRDQCLEAIRDYARQPHGEDGTGNSPGRKLALTTRPAEYDMLGHRVEMAAAQVELVSDEQVEDLLKSMPPLQQALDSDPNPAALRPILNTPLMLALLYEGASAEPSRAAEPKNRIYAQFLDATLDQMEGYAADDSQRWLGWLAASLEREDTARFDLEDLGPDWLRDQRSERQARLLFRLVVGLVVGLDEALVTLPVAERTEPAEGVHRSLRYARRFGGTGMLAAILLGLLLPFVEAPLEALGEIGVAVSGGLASAPVMVAWLSLVLGLYKGGGFALRHYVVRFILWRRRLAPRDYVPFLVQAAQKGILKPVGGGFQFRHRDLRRFIADRYGDEWLDSTSDDASTS